MIRKEPNKVEALKIKSWIIWLLFFLCLMVFGKAGIAFSDSSLEIAPFYTDVKIEKGEKEKKVAIKITNNSESDAEIKLSFVDLDGMDESGGIAFQGLDPGKLAGGGKYKLAKWVDLEKENISIKPGGTELVRLAIKNDEDLSPGGHYGALLAQAVSPQDADNKNAMISPVLSSLVFLNKIDGGKYGLALDNIELEKNMFALPEKTKLIFSNGGNVHIVPRGTVVIKDFLGRTVSNSVINQESRYVFPETEKTFTIPMKILPVMKISGRYEMQIGYRYDGKDEFETKEVSFFYINPVHTGLVLLLTILLFSSILYRLSIKARKKGQNGTEYEQKSP